MLNNITAQFLTDWIQSNWNDFVGQFNDWICAEETQAAQWNYCDYLNAKEPTAAT